MTNPDPYTGNFRFLPPGVKSLEYRIFVADLRTSQIWTELPYIGVPTWNDSLALGTSGAMKVTCPLSDPRAAKDDRSLLRLMRGISTGPWRYVFILMLNQQCLFAGPLITHKVSPDKAEIEFGIASINSILDKRIVANFTQLANPRGYDADLHFLSPTKINWIAVQLLINMVSSPNDTDNNSRSVPLYTDSKLWGNQPIGTETREYLAVDLGTYYEAFKKFTEMDNGPDIYFKPMVDDNCTYFWWQFMCGDPYLGDMHHRLVWDYGVNCLSIGEDSDASKMTTRAYVPGDGQDEGKLIGYAANFSRVMEGFPALETVASSNTQEGRNQRAIDKAAAGYVAAYQKPTMKWDIEVDPHQWPMVGDFTMGDTFRMSIADHHWVEDGEYYHRILGYNGDTSKLNLVTAEFQKGTNLIAA